MNMFLNAPVWNIEQSHLFQTVPSVYLLAYMFSIFPLCLGLAVQNDFLNLRFLKKLRTRATFIGTSQSNEFPCHNNTITLIISCDIDKDWLLWDVTSQISSAVWPKAYVCGPFDCGDRGFESRWSHRCSSLVFVFCWAVSVLRMDWSLNQRSPTGWVWSINLQTRRHSSSVGCTFKEVIWHVIDW
jgi:hypothetical protein